MLNWYKEGDQINKTGLYAYRPRDKSSVGFRIVVKGTENYYLFLFRFSKTTKKFHKMYRKLNIEQLQRGFDEATKIPSTGKDKKVTN